MTDDPDPTDPAAIEARLAGLEATMASIGGAVEGHTAWLTDLERWVGSCVNAMVLFGAEPPSGTTPGVSGAPDVIGRLLTWVEIQTLMSWIANAAIVEDGPLVSVNVATRDRPVLLERAIASILGQSYRRLELIVIDDSDQPATGAMLSQLEDPRVRIIRTPARRGAGAAFNAGLDGIRGELVAFLDDDNVMHRDWLRSIVWAFGQRPGTDALYGARIKEDLGATSGEASGAFPTFEFSRYDRDRHERASFIDRNVMAIRAKLAGARYDERLPRGLDWDYTLRMFARSPPLALPVVACYYTTLGPERISDRPEVEALRTVRSRAHAARPLRVHAHRCKSDPTGLAADLRALVNSGAQVTLSSRVGAPAIDGVGRWQLEVEAALSDARPDLVLLPSPADAARELKLLEAHDLPFVIRWQDDSAEPDTSLRAHPLRLGAIDESLELERALRKTLTRWLYERA